MSDAQTPQADPLFAGLILGLQQTAWVQLGKIAHPETGSAQADLEAAHQTIDVLGMLEKKTRGNLTGEEERLLTALLTELRLNYVAELKRQKDAKEAPAAQSAGAETAAAAQQPESGASPGTTGEAKRAATKPESPSP